MKELSHNLNRTIERTAVTYQPYIARTASILVMMTVLSALLYSVFLLEAVGQAASRTDAQRQIQGLGTQLSVLEGQYLAATEALTPARAQALGFVTPSQISTVVVDGNSSALSFGGR